MSTALESPGRLRRQPELVGVPAGIVLFGVGFWLAWNTDSLLPSQLLLLFAAGSMVWVALASPTVAVRAIAWFLGFVCMAFSIAAWALANHDYGTDGAQDALLYATMALSPVGFLWVSWRLPRPRVDTYAAEVGLALFGLLGLSNLRNEYTSDMAYAPLEFMWIYLGVAAVFAAAAWLVPSRRIFYGVTALAMVIVAVFRQVFLYWGMTDLPSGDYYPGLEFATVDQLFALTAFGIPAIGALLQIAWWVRGKVRAVA